MAADFVVRHVLAVDEVPPLDDLGFLRLMRDTDYDLVGQPRPIVLEELLRADSFVLLAPGAAGKTRALEHLAALEEGALVVDLRAKSLGEARAELTDARGRGQSVYVDHLDEVFATIPQLPRLLRSVVGGSGPSTEWRFGCRHVAWTDGLGAAVQGQVKQYRLLPVSRDSARELMGAITDADEFFSVLERHRLRFLPSAPERLRILASSWGDFEDSVPDLLEVLRLEVDGLLQESDPLRDRPTGSLDRRRTIAGRLAAFTTLCGVPGFTARGAPGSRGVPLETLPDRPEPSTPDERVTLNDYGEALASGVFEPFGADLVRFRHEQLAEYFAASYLASRTPTVAQAQQLLRLSTDGVLPGRLAGLASWLGAITPDLVEHVVAHNPLVFAQSGAELPDAELRRAVVRAMLAAAAQGDLEWTWIVDLTTLDYPEMADDLLEAAGRPWQGYYLPWWVARLAESAGRSELVPILVQWACDDELAPAARCAAIDALGHLGGTETKRELLPLLHAAEDDEIRGHCLKVLYPECLSTQDLMTVLTPISRTVIGGAYSTFLRDLADHLDEDGLVEFLGLLATWNLRRPSQHAGIASSALAGAWAAAGESDRLLEAIAEFLVHVYQREHTLDLPHDHPVPWLDGDVDQRRCLATEVARQYPTGQSALYTLLDASLVQREDLHWLLNGLHDLEAAPRNQLLTCIVPLISRPSVDLAELILTLPEHHYAFEVTEPLRGEQPLNTERYQRRQEIARRDAEQRAARAESVERFGDDIIVALEQAEKDVSTWWILVHRLGETRGEPDPARTDDPLFSCDLKRRPGWSHLGSGEPARVMELGARFITEHKPTPEFWIGKQTLSGGDLEAAFRDWAGAYLLTTLARHDLDTLVGLPDGVLGAWAPALVGAWNFGPDADVDLPAEVLDALATANRTVALEAFGVALLEDLDARRSSAPDKPVPDWWQRLVPLVASEIEQQLRELDEARPVDRRLFELMTKAEPPSALELAVAICETSGHPLRNAALELRGRYPDHVAELLDGDLDAGDLQALCHNLDATALSSDLVERLLHEMLAAQSLADDPPLNDLNGPHGYERDRFRQQRTALANELASRGAVKALRGLEESRPDDERWWWRRLTISAKQAAAEMEDERPSPTELLRLLEASDARFVRSADDLLELTVRCLDEVQRAIRDGAWKALWNIGTGQGPQQGRPNTEDDVTDEIKRLLDPLVKGRASVDREVQVARPRMRGVGQRADIIITAGRGQHRLLIEAKHLHNDGLLTSISEQLVERYLDSGPFRHGIYLVYWIDPAERPSTSASKATTRDECYEELANLAAGLAPGVKVVPYLLDITPPQRR